MSLRYQLAQSLEYRWWKQYLGKKDPDSYLNWKKKYWRDFLSKLPDSLLENDNQVVADLGCGPAGIFLVLNQNKIIAVDPLFKKYKQLDFFNPERNSNVIFMESKIEDLEIHEALDGVFCLNAINHVQDFDQALKRIESVLKPGGWLVLSSDIHKKLWTRNLFKSCSWIDPLHPQQDHSQDYESAFKKLNLKKEISFEHGENFLFEYRVWLLRKSV